MSLHDGLDLSRFTRVSSDKKTTTLRHRNGHELKIANSALTPKMKERIDALKEHGEESRKAFAGGTPNGTVGTDDDPPQVAPPAQTLDPSSPAQAAPAAPEQTQGIAPEAQPQPAQQTQQPQAPATPPKPAQMPVAGEVNITATQPPPKPTPQQMAQQMNQHDMQYQQDLAKGYIQPKTYQDLFAEKSTIGKIGTLFGLLVSGAGAGLTHQPNAVMEMMNKEIERDFEKQKKNQENTQNWYTMSLKHELQNAQIEQMGVQNVGTLSQAGLTQAQTAKVPAEIERLKAETAGIGMQTQLGSDTHQQNLIRLGMMQKLGNPGGETPPDLDLKADAQGKNLMTMTLLQELQNNANKMPDGPQKQAYLSALSTVTAAANQQIAKRNEETAAKIGALDTLRAATAPVEKPKGGEDTGVDIGRLNELSRQAALGEVANLPPQTPDGQPFNAQDLAKAKEEADMVARNRALAKIYDRSFKKLDAMFANGKLNPAMRDAEITLVADEIVNQVSGGGVSGAKAHEMAEAMFPGIKDWGGASKAKYENTMHQFEARESSAVTAKRLGVVKPFPKSGPKYKEGTISSDGKSIVKGGKWVPTGATKQATK